jgi:hypothetical protein
VSYIAVDLDAFNRVPYVAQASSLAPERVTHGLVSLWAYCFREKVEHVSRVHVRGFFGGDACDALEAFGFLENVGEGSFRVKGADRYLRVAKARSEGGKKSASNLKKGTGKGVQPEAPSPGSLPATPPAPAGEQPELLPGSPPAEPRLLHRAPSTELNTSASAPAAAPKQRTASQQEDFFGWAQGQLAQKKPARTAEGPPKAVVLNSQLKEPLRRVGREGLEVAWRHFMADPWADNQGHPWSAFVSTWEKHFNAAKAQPREVREQIRICR